MNAQLKAFIAGVGMITPVGINAKMTVASVKAGINAYSISSYKNGKNENITVAAVPKEFFDATDIYIEEGDEHSSQYDHIIKMAITALKETVKGKNIAQPVPLILAMPEPSETAYHIKPEVLIYNLVNQDDLPLAKETTRCIHTGRAAGMQALELGLRYLFDANEEFVLVGGSDSCMSNTYLDSIEQERLKTEFAMDSYVPGEGAGFILLTRNPQHAMKRDNQVISLQEPGIADEPGHLFSKEPYKGEGLDVAFKKVLANNSPKSINKIYSSMNGENHWAKEYGVASIRNEAHFRDDVTTEHPADCFGDMGCATSTVLMGLSVLNLLQDDNDMSHLVYSSSDGALRGAVKLDKRVI